MAWYVSIQPTTGRGSGRRALAAGPYDTHGQALRMMRSVTTTCLRLDPVHAPWANVGTCRTRASRPPAHPVIMAALGDAPAGLP